jgi:hypothetical protein
MTGRLALILVVAILLGGCSSAPGPAESHDAPLALYDVRPASASEASRAAAFESRGGDPWGGGFSTFVEWQRLAAEDVPRRFAPADTLGRGLLVAMVASHDSSRTSAAHPIAAARLLFKDGLTVRATTDRGWALDRGRFKQYATQFALHPDPSLSLAETATVGSELALVTVGPKRSSDLTTATVVEWVATPWTYSVELDRADASAALRVARSMQR